MEKVEWNEKKTSLGNAIIIGAVLALIGFIVGMNFKTWFSGFAPYLGVDSVVDSNID